MAKQEISHEDIIEVIQDLGSTIAQSFTGLEQKFTGLEQKVDAGFAQNQREHEAMQVQFRTINARLDLIETDLSDLRQLHQEVRAIRELLDEVATRRELEVLKKRLARVERHLGLK